MRSKRLELARNRMSDWMRAETNKVPSQTYLVWSSPESDASNLGYLFSDFHIETFLCVQALIVESERPNLYMHITHGPDGSASLGQ